MGIEMLEWMDQAIQSWAYLTELSLGPLKNTLRDQMMVMSTADLMVFLKVSASVSRIVDLREKMKDLLMIQDSALQMDLKKTY